MNKLNLPYCNPFSFIYALENQYNLNFNKIHNTFSSSLPYKLAKGWLRVFVFNDIHFIRAKYRYSQKVVFNSTDNVGGDNDVIDFRIRLNDLRSSYLNKEKVYNWQNDEVDAISLFIPRKYFKQKKSIIFNKYYNIRYNTELLYKLKSLLEYEPKNEVEFINLESKFLNFLYLFISYINKPLVFESKNYNKAIPFKIKEILDLNYINPPSIKEISKMVGTNTTYLQMVFKDVYTTTIKQYCINKKMEKAVELILYSDMPVTHICKDLGYSNRSHFNQLYFRHTGYTPKLHRQSHNYKTLA